MFPQGGPGVALILLRISVAGIALFSFRTYGSLVPHWILPVLVLVLISVCLGFLTPVFSVLLCILHLYYLIAAGTDSTPIHLSAILNAVALAFLGPGAYSLDAKRFGRRVVTIPPAKAAERD